MTKTTTRPGPNYFAKCRGESPAFPAATNSNDFDKTPPAAAVLLLLSKMFRFFF